MVSIGKEATWAAQQVWRRREKFLPLPENHLHHPDLSHITDWGITAYRLGCTCLNMY
jgi:hypothetical protein